MRVLSLNIVNSSTSHLVSSDQYPSDNLACKMHYLFNVDCSRRNLLEIPVLEQSLATFTLDLSNNRLQNITNSPFQNMQNLLALNLDVNKISLLSSTAFKGLHKLIRLYLSENKLVDLPKDVFLDLSNLTILKMEYNYFTAIPTHAFEPLHSLQQFSFFRNNAIIFDLNFDRFKNTLYLKKLNVFVSIATNITNDIFLPFSRVPLRELSFDWYWPTSCQFEIERNVFAPIGNVTSLFTSFSSIPALESLSSPLNRLVLITPSYPCFELHALVINKLSFQVLNKWNSSLILTLQ